jgi:hypothetical protein
MPRGTVSRRDASPDGSAGAPPISLNVEPLDLRAIAESEGPTALGLVFRDLADEQASRSSHTSHTSYSSHPTHTW